MEHLLVDFGFQNYIFQFEDEWVVFVGKRRKTTLVFEEALK